MIKYLGTHNSGTSYKLVWWQRLFTWPLQLVSQCQSRTIEQQLKDGIKLFNLQITNYNDEWVFSHGLCIYNKKVDEILLEFTKYADNNCPIYFTMSLDKNFILGQKIEKYKEYTEIVKTFCDNHKNIILLYSIIEGANEVIYKNDKSIYSSEHYWSLTWAKSNAKTWIDKLPLPKRHAKIYNKQYIEENKADYLMIDFYEI